MKIQIKQPFTQWGKNNYEIVNINLICHLKDGVHFSTVPAVSRKECFDQSNEEPTNDAMDKGHDHMDIIEHDKNRIKNGA